MTGSKMRFSRSGLPATLVPDGAAPRTQESHPSALDGLGAHIERLNLHCPLGATPCDPTATMRDPSTPTGTRAEHVGRDWVGPSST